MCVYIYIYINRASSNNKWAQYEVCGAFLGRGMGMNITAITTITITITIVSIIVITVYTYVCAHVCIYIYTHICYSSVVLCRRHSAPLVVACRA